MTEYTLLRDSLGRKLLRQGMAERKRGQGQGLVGLSYGQGGTEPDEIELYVYRLEDDQPKSIVPDARFIEAFGKLKRRHKTWGQVLGALVCHGPAPIFFLFRKQASGLALNPTLVRKTLRVALAELAIPGLKGRKTIVVDWKRLQEAGGIEALLAADDDEQTEALRALLGDGASDDELGELKLILKSLNREEAAEQLEALDAALSAVPDSDGVFTAAAPLSEVEVGTLQDHMTDVFGEQMTKTVLDELSDFTLTLDREEFSLPIISEQLVQSTSVVKKQVDLASKLLPDEETKKKAGRLLDDLATLETLDLARGTLLAVGKESFGDIGDLAPFETKVKLDESNAALIKRVMEAFNDLGVEITDFVNGLGETEDGIDDIVDDTTAYDTAMTKIKSQIQGLI